MQMKVLTMTTVLLAAVAAAKSPVEPLNTGKDKLAVKGYDTVAYFNQGKPVKGAPQWSHQWMGADWRFSSAANRDLFQKTPEQYVPQFGGYCAWAVGHNYTANADPEAWKIVDGKLYLNYSKSVQKMWEKDQGKWIEDGHKNWPGLHK